MKIKLAGEYHERGEYHKELDLNWSYYPIYIRKLKFIDKYINKYKNSKIKILDAGCGEGVIVEKYKKQGFDIVGLDFNYQSEFVVEGDILNMPFEQNTFDLVFYLDVIEHLQPKDQGVSLVSIKKIIKNDGRLIISIPNLAHKASRWKFFRTGMFERTANILKHPGDRPIKEFIQLIENSGFIIEQRFPIKLTLPPSIDRMMKFFIGNKRYENFIYSPKRNADDCFLNIFVLNNKEREL